MTEENTQTSFDVVAEIKNAVAIIDHAADQGAFRGWDAINQVFACRARLLSFVQMMEQALAAPNEVEAQTETPSESDNVAPIEPETTAIVADDAVADDTPVANAELEDIQREYTETLKTLEALREKFDQAGAKALDTES